MSTLEDEFEDLLASAYMAAYGKAASAEWLRTLSMRAGTHGSVATLDEAGSVMGVTRERVRQVMAKVQSHLDGAVIPHLTEAARLLAERSPVPEPIGWTLSRDGLTRTTLTGEAFLNMVSLVGSSPRDLIGTDLVRVENWVVEESEVRVMSSLSMAKKHTGAFGMTTVEEIRQALSTPEHPLDRRDVYRVLKADPTVKWAGDWLWVEKADNLRANRLVNTARSILSVNSPQTVQSIHEGARRLWKFRRLDILPSSGAMKAFFEASAYFVVEGDLVGPVEPLDYREVLGGVAVTMVDLLKSSEYGVMDRQSLNDACEDAGIARGTFGVWTTYKEWMERFAPNVWGLRGSHPNPAAVEAIRRAAHARSEAEPHRKKWAWDADGTAVQTMDVTTSFLSTGVLTLEPGIHNLVAGLALPLYHEGHHVGTAKLGADHGFCWGWHPALAALDAKQGDVLEIRVNVAGHRKAELRIGGQELWD